MLEKLTTTCEVCEFVALSLRASSNSQVAESSSLTGLTGQRTRLRLVERVER